MSLKLTSTPVFKIAPIESTSPIRAFDFSKVSSPLISCITFPSSERLIPPSLSTMSLRLCLTAYDTSDLNTPPRVVVSAPLSIRSIAISPFPVFKVQYRGVIEWPGVQYESES